MSIESNKLLSTADVDPDRPRKTGENGLNGRLAAMEGTYGAACGILLGEEGFHRHFELERSTQCSAHCSSWSSQCMRPAPTPRRRRAPSRSLPRALRLAAP